MSIVNFPASYEYYLENASSLDILNDQEAPPPNFTMEQTVNFFKAKGMLEVCKAELYTFLTDTYAKTWGVALEPYAETLKPFSVKDFDKLGVETLLEEHSVENCWDDVAIRWYYKHSSFRILCGVWVEETSLNFFASVHDGSEWSCGQLQGVEGWVDSDDKDDIAYMLLTDSLPLNQGQIDLTPAMERLASMAKCLSAVKKNA